MRKRTSPTTAVPALAVLAVGAPEGDGVQLETIFRESGWELGRVRTRAEARAFLDTTPVRIVISERELTEGGWREMLNDLEQRPEPPLLIVTSRFADEALWAEVLNMGGYDVLAKPLDREEVTRVIGAALRHFDNEQQRRRPQSAKPFVMAVAS